MNFDQAVKNLQEKFKSGNDIPVTRAAITREEFEAIEKNWKRNGYAPFEHEWPSKDL